MTIPRRRLKSRFDRFIISSGFNNCEWLKKRVNLTDLFNVVLEIEKLT